MIPKIEFRYSWIYDQTLQRQTMHGHKFDTPYPSTRKVLSFIKGIEKPWRKEEKRVLEEMARVSGLEWKTESIPCYVVGRARPISDPLTVPTYSSKTWFVDVLTHELIHQLFTQGGNFQRTKETFDYFIKKYNKEPHKTRIHVPLHAVHSHLYLKLFNGRRLQRDIDMMSAYPAYKRSWEIVQKEGYQNIIKEFTGRIKR